MRNDYPDAQPLSLKEISDRDTVLLAADVLTRAALGSEWTLEAHRLLKRALLGIVDGVRP
jgi:hypothetical protein